MSLPINHGKHEIVAFVHCILLLDAVDAIRLLVIHIQLSATNDYIDERLMIVSYILEHIPLFEQNILDIMRVDGINPLRSSPTAREMRVKKRTIRAFILSVDKNGYI